MVPSGGAPSQQSSSSSSSSSSQPSSDRQQSHVLHRHLPQPPQLQTYPSFDRYLFPRPHSLASSGSSSTSPSMLFSQSGGQSPSPSPSHPYHHPPPPYASFQQQQQQAPQHRHHSGPAFIPSTAYPLTHVMAHKRAAVPTGVVGQHQSATHPPIIHAHGPPTPAVMVDSPSAARAKKRTRPVSACEVCRIKKIKCVLPLTDASCRGCQSSGNACYFRLDDLAPALRAQRFAAYGQGSLPAGRPSQKTHTAAATDRPPAVNGSFGMGSARKERKRASAGPRHTQGGEDDETITSSSSSKSGSPTPSLVDESKRIKPYMRPSVGHLAYDAARYDASVAASAAAGEDRSDHYSQPSDMRPYSEWPMAGQGQQGPQKLPSFQDAFSDLDIGPDGNLRSAIYGHDTPPLRNHLPGGYSDLRKWYARQSPGGLSRGEVSRRAEEEAQLSSRPSLPPSSSTSRASSPRRSFQQGKADSQRTNAQDFEAASALVAVSSSSSRSECPTSKAGSPERDAACVSVSKTTASSSDADRLAYCIERWFESVDDKPPRRVVSAEDAQLGEAHLFDAQPPNTNFAPRPSARAMQVLLPLFADAFKDVTPWLAHEELNRGTPPPDADDAILYAMCGAALSVVSRAGLSVDGPLVSLKPEVFLTHAQSTLGPLIVASLSATPSDPPQSNTVHALELLLLLALAESVAGHAVPANVFASTAVHVAELIRSGWRETKRGSVPNTAAPHDVNGRAAHKPTTAAAAACDSVRIEKIIVALECANPLIDARAQAVRIGGDEGEEAGMDIDWDA